MEAIKEYATAVALAEHCAESYERALLTHAAVVRDANERLARVQNALIQAHARVTIAKAALAQEVS